MSENSPTDTHFIRVEQVTRRFARGDEVLTVLRSISLTVARSDFLSLMGPSGSGKSTLLNLIAGLDRPDQGTVTVGGVALGSLGESQLARWRADNVGFVFQFYNLIPVLSAVENVALPLLLFPLSRRERLERAQFALELVGLKDRSTHRPAELSGGQEQRVAIARAIVTDPALIVADEPTGDLDRASAGEVLELLRRLNREHGKTIIMVTHDPAAAQFASRLIHLDKGELYSDQGPSR